MLFFCWVTLLLLVLVHGETDQTAVGPIKPVAGRNVLAIENADDIANTNTVKATQDTDAVANIKTVMAPQSTDAIADINTADTTNTVKATDNAAAVANINSLDATNKVAEVDTTDEANKADHYGGWGTHYYPSYGWGTGLGYGRYGGYGHHHHHHHHGGLGWRKLLTIDKADTTTAAHADNAATAANAPANSKNANGGWDTLGGFGWDGNFPSGYGHGFGRRGFNRWGGRKLLRGHPEDMK